MCVAYNNVAYVSLLRAAACHRKASGIKRNGVVDDKTCKMLPL
jgi:hypothetical protein